MERKDLQKKKLPDAPGVYFFLGKRKEILYIGKATSLRSRVRSYFDGALREKRSALIEAMVEEANDISWTVTDSVLEAMLLEVNLIRTHKPRCNTRSKDDKSYNHLVITREAFPRVLVIRGKDLREEDERTFKYIFGPFPNATLFKEALRIIRRLFQFYDTKREVGSVRSAVERGKIDFNRQIGLYPSGISKRSYARTINHIRLLFEGKKQMIIDDFTKEMHRYARKEQFEEAARVRNKIRALEHIQDVSLIKDESRVHQDDRSMRIEAYDVAHLGGDDMVGAMVVVAGGERDPSEYRKFNIEQFTRSNDVGALSEMLLRRLGHGEWKLPELIVVDGSTAQKNVAEKCLKKFNLTIPVVGVVKDEHHKPKRFIGPKKLIDEHKQSILLANAEAHRFAITYHKSKRKVV